MAMLGDLLAAARASSGAFLSFIEGTDPSMAQAVVAAAERDGTTPTSFVRAAVAQFSRLASEEDWATLTSAMRDAEDPGAVCLVAMVHWRLTVSGCEHHACGHGAEAGLLARMST